jgi:hypothetical protein
MSNPFELKLYFIDGKPDGRLTVKVPGWTGHILVSPKPKLRDVLKRKQSSYYGVYILLGGDENGEQLAYIGEGKSMKERIKKHYANKNWWTKVVLITSSENDLNKAQTEYIEARLIQEGKKANNINLENSKNPEPEDMLEEADEASMEAFIKQLLMILPAIQVDMFVSKIRQDESQQITHSNENPVFELNLIIEGITATLIIVDGEYVVQKGSLARGEYIGKRSPKYSYWRLYDKLVEQGVLVKLEDSDNLVFTKSYAFSSTSAAGAVCNGRSTSGPLAWKVQGTGQTYKNWEIERLDRD